MSERLTHAAHNLNYEGTFIYEHNGHMQTMRIIHSAGPGGERERLVTLSGPSREVIRDRNTVTCFLPDTNAVMVERTGRSHSLPLALPTGLDALDKYYIFSVKGEDRIAGRKVRELTIRPRDMFRYGYNIWIDEKDGLLLKSELLNAQGKPVEQMLFTSITLYKQIPPKLLKPHTQGKGMTWYRQPPAQEEKLSASAWKIGEMPAGFREYVHHRVYLPNSKHRVEHMVFSDGLSSVSVFIEPEHGSTSTPPLGESQLGAVSAYSRVVDGHRITVVGEVPQATVEMIAESIHHMENGQ